MRSGVRLNKSTFFEEVSVFLAPYWMDVPL